MEDGIKHPISGNTEWQIRAIFMETALNHCIEQFA